MLGYGGDFFEWISTEDDIMPDGRWALYVDSESVDDHPTLGMRSTVTIGAQSRPIK